MARGFFAGRAVLDLCGVFGVLVVLLVAIAVASALRRRDTFVAKVDTVDLTGAGARNVCLLSATQVDDTCDGDFNVKDKLFFGDPTMNAALPDNYYISKVVDGQDPSLRLSITDAAGSFRVLGQGRGVAHKFDAGGRAAHASTLNVGTDSTAAAGGTLNLWTAGGLHSFFGGGGDYDNMISDDTLVSGQLDTSGQLDVNGSLVTKNQLCVGNRCINETELSTLVDVSTTFASDVKTKTTDIGKQGDDIKVIWDKVYGPGGLMAKYEGLKTDFADFKQTIGTAQTAQDLDIQTRLGLLSSQWDAEMRAVDDNIEQASAREKSLAQGQALALSAARALQDTAQAKVDAAAKAVADAKKEAKRVADAAAKVIADAAAKVVADAAAKVVADAEAKRVADAAAKVVADAETARVQAAADAQVETARVQAAADAQAADAAAASHVTRRMNIVSQLRNNYCVDVKNGTKESGGWGGPGVLLMQDCAANASQEWTYDSSRRLVNTNSGMCMNVYGAWTANGTAVVQFPCGSAANELWTMKGDGTLRPDHAPNSCLDVDRLNTANGTKVQLWQCNGGVNQKFSEPPSSDMQWVVGNNGAVSCDMYCRGTAYKPWNGELPMSWNGAKGVGGFVGGRCLCKKTGAGWERGIGW